MKYYNIIFGLLCIFGFSFATNFNSCQTFSTPDTYDLTSNIQINASSCLTVSSPNVIIDCHGFEIVGNYTANTYGIAIQHSDNFTLQNCIFRQFGSALTFTNGSHSLMRNNTFDNSTASGLLFSSNDLISHNVTFTNNTVSNNWNNGIEIYNMSDGNFSFNTFFGHEHGHGTDRTGQFVRNVANTHWSNNYMYNNTICFRNDATNVSNIFIENNICENVTGTGFLTFSGASSAVGRFGNFTMRNNTVTASPTSIGFDYGWAASTTTQNDCANWLLADNMATGGAYLMLNSSNSSTSIANLNVGGLLICDADNLQLSNINIQGGGLGRNGIEIMQVNNMSLFNLTANNIYTGIRGLIVNDSVFDTLNINGGQISSINFAGGTSSRNNLSNIQISNVSANAAVSMGGVGNYVSGLHISDSNTSGWVIGFQSSTTAVNNTFDGFDVQNTPVAIGVTNLGSGNTIKNGFIKNVTYAFFINSTASGIKTITLENITLSDATESHSTNLDLFKTINPSEILYISLPEAIPAFSNSSYIDLQSYLNRTSTGSANVSIDQLNISIGEVPLEYSRLKWWTYNGSAWLEQTVINNGNGKLTYNGAKVYPIGISYLDAIFYSDMCPVINQSGYIVALQNYSGAPNPITGLSNACVVINTSNVQFDCRHPIFSTSTWITNDGSASATGVYIPTGIQNVTVSNCNVQQYYYGGYSVNNQNVSFFSNNFFNNSITGLYLDSSDSNTIYNNTFNLNQIGLEFAFGDDSNYIAENIFGNNSVRAFMLGSSNSNTIHNNTFDTNNIAITLQSALSNLLTFNNIINSGYQSVQAYSSTDTIFQNNLWQSNYVGFDGSSDSNLRFENNFLNYSNGGGSFYLSGSNNLSFQNNQFINGRTCNLCLDTSTDVNIYNNTIIDAGQNLGYSAPNLQYSGNNFNIENNVILNASSVNIDSNAINSTIQNNTIGYSPYGIYLNSGSQINIERNNFIFGETGIGFDTYSQAVIFNNTFSDQQNQNILLFSSPSNLLFDSNSFNINSAPNINFGGATMSNVSLLNNNFTSLSDNLYIDSSSGLYASGNRFTGINSGVRIRPSSTNNQFYYNTFLGCGYGILVEGGSNNQFNFNNISASTNYGVQLSSGSTNTFNSNNIFLNPRGISILSANNTTGQDNHFYANIYDLYIDSASDTRFFNLTNSVFDYDGTFTNYSNVSINDISSSSESYSFNWSYQPDYATSGNLSYRNSSINLTLFNPSSISSIIFNYFDAGLNSTNELTMKIFRYDGTWNTTGSTVDTTNNRVTLLGFSSDAILSLLYDVASPILVTSTTINYYSSHPYSSYSIANGEITTLDTGLFQISYNGSGVDPTLISPITVLIVMIPVVAIGLLIIGVNRFFRSDDV